MTLNFLKLLASFIWKPYVWYIYQNLGLSNHYLNGKLWYKTCPKLSPLARYSKSKMDMIISMVMNFQVQVLSISVNFNSCKSECNSLNGHLPFLFEGLGQKVTEYCVEHLSTTSNQIFWPWKNISNMTPIPSRQDHWSIIHQRHHRSCKISNVSRTTTQKNWKRHAVLS